MAAIPRPSPDERMRAFYDRNEGIFPRDKWLLSRKFTSSGRRDGDLFISGTMNGLEVWIAYIHYETEDPDVNFYFNGYNYTHHESYFMTIFELWMKSGKMTSAILNGDRYRD